MCWIKNSNSFFSKLNYILNAVVRLAYTGLFSHLIGLLSDLNQFGTDFFSIFEIQPKIGWYRLLTHGRVDYWEKIQYLFLF